MAQRRDARLAAALATILLCAAAAAAARAPAGEGEWGLQQLEQQGLGSLRSLLAADSAAKKVRRPRKTKCVTKITGCPSCWKTGSDPATVCAGCSRGYTFNYETQVCDCAQNYGTFCKTSRSSRAGNGTETCTCKRCKAKESSTGGAIGDASCDPTETEGVNRAGLSATLSVDRPCSDDATPDLGTALSEAIGSGDGVSDVTSVSMSKCTNVNKGALQWGKYVFKATFNTEKKTPGEKPTFVWSALVKALKESVCDELAESQHDGGCSLSTSRGSGDVPANPTLPDSWTIALPLKSLAANGACPTGSELDAAVKSVGDNLAQALRTMPGIRAVSTPKFAACKYLGSSTATGEVVELWFNVAEIHGINANPISKLLGATTTGDSGSGAGTLCTDSTVLPSLCTLEPRFLPDYAYAYGTPVSCEPGGWRRADPQPPKTAESNDTYVYELPDSSSAAATKSVSTTAWFDPRDFAPWALGGKTGNADATIDPTYALDGSAALVVNRKGQVVKRMATRARSGATKSRVAGSMKLKSQGALKGALRKLEAGTVQGALLLSVNGGNGVYFRDTVMTIGVPVSGPTIQGFKGTCTGFNLASDQKQDASKASLIGTLAAVSSITASIGIPDDTDPGEGSEYAYLQISLFLTNKPAGQAVTYADVVELVYQPGPHQSDDFSSDLNLAESFWYQRRRDLSDSGPVDMFYVPRYTEDESTAFPTLAQYAAGKMYKNKVQNAKGDATYTTRSLPLSNSTRVLAVGVGIAGYQPADPTDAGDGGDEETTTLDPKPAANAQARTFWVSQVKLSMQVFPDDEETLKDYSANFVAVVADDPEA